MFRLMLPCLLIIFGQSLIAQDCGGWNRTLTDHSHLVHSLGFGGGQFVATTAEGTVFTSGDAVAWQGHVFPQIRVYDLIWDGARFVGVGRNEEKETAQIVIGQSNSWETADLDETHVVTGIAYNGETYVASSPDGLFTGTDGLTWAFDAPYIGQWQDVTWSRGLFVAVAYNGAVITSPDGVNWSPQWYDRPRSLGIAGNDDVFVISGSSLVTGMTGKSWQTAAPADRGDSWEKVVWTSDLFVTYSHMSTGFRHHFYTSPDGFSWTKTPLPGDMRVYDVISGNGIWLFSGTETAFVDDRYQSVPVIFRGSCQFPEAPASLITHVTRFDGSFATNIWLRNPTAETRFYELVAYDREGVDLGRASGSLEPGNTLQTTATALFESEDVSHIRLNQATELEVQVSYLRKDGAGGTAQVGASAASAKQWLLLPAGQEGYWDGIAVINRGVEAIDVQARQLDAAGNLLSEVTVVTGLSPNAKGLVNLSALFPITPDSRFLITAPQNLSLLALRGDSDSTLLVPGSAQPLEVNP